MHGHVLATRPGVLQDVAGGHVARPARSRSSRTARLPGPGGAGGPAVCGGAGARPDVAQPVVGQPHAVCQRRTHAAAAVVAHHHDVLHLEWSTANWITDSAFRSECTTTLATLRCTNTSPGSSPVIWLAGTRLSEQPIHRYLGVCCAARRGEEAGALLLHLGGPGAVVVDEELDIGGHARMVAKGRPRRGRRDARPKVGAGLTSSRRTARGRSACGGSRWCRRRSRTAWRRATGGPAGTR
jgi:hypothetical protein